MMNISQRFFQSACLELIKKIKQYGKHNFSAYGLEFTDDEAQEIAGRLIHTLIDKNSVYFDKVTLDFNIVQIRGL